MENCYKIKIRYFSLESFSLALLASLVLAMLGQPPVYAAGQESIGLGKAISISLARQPVDASAPQLMPLAFVPVITATKTYTLTNDADSDGQADPGDTLQYTIVISNSGDMDGLNLFFTDILTNLLSLSGTLRTTPLALPDVYSATGNVQINIAAPGVLTNDLDLDGGPITVAPFTGNSTNNGNVTLNGDGSFSYNPPAGFEGLDSFNYTISDDEGETDTGTVVINVTDMIWFIDNSAGAAGDGRLSSPFNSLAAFQAVNNGTGNNPAVGDNIFIYSGSGSYTGGVTLLNNQQLFGQGATASLPVLTGITPPPGSLPLPSTGGISPTLVNANSHVIQIEDNNSIAGLIVNANNANPLNAGISGNNDGGTTSVNEVAINMSSSGSGISLIGQTGVFSFSNGSITGNSSLSGAVGVDGGNAIIDFTSVTINKSGGGLIGIRNKSGGSVNFVGGSITGSNLNTAPVAGITLLNNVGVIDFGNGFNVSTTNAPGLQANNSGTVNLGGTSSVINATGGPGVDVTATSLGSGWTFSSVSSTNSGTTGVNLVNITAGSFTANGGTISGATGTAFNVGTATNNSGGTTDIAYAGAINNGAGRSVLIQERNGGTVTLSGNINDTGTGILVQNNNNGTANTVTFSSASKVLNTGANSAVTLDNNDDAIINFIGGGLDIDTTSGTGFSAIAGGVVNVTGTDNRIDTGTGTALSVLNTTIGGSGVTFRSISIVGAVNGIVLNNTGSSGGLTITGDGTNAQNSSGGTIQNTTGDGISLIDSQGIVFNQIVVDGTGRHGIFGDGVNNLTINNSRFNNTGDANDENTFEFRATTGSGDSAIGGNLILNNVDVTNFHDAGLIVYNESGSLTVDIDDSDFDDNDDTDGTDAFFIETEGTASVTVDINGGLFNNLEGDVLLFEGGGSGTNDVNIRSVRSINGGGPDNFPNGGGIEIRASGGQNVTFDIQGNELLDQRGDPLILAAPVGAGGGDLEGRVGGPNIGDGNTFSGSSLGDGIQLTLEGPASDFTILIQNNDIGVDNTGSSFNGLGDDGIQILHRDNSGSLNLTIEDNTIANTVSEAIRFFSDEDTGVGAGNPTSNVRIANNAFVNVDSDNNENEIELRTSDTAQVCYHVSGNDDGVGNSPGVINFSIAGTSTAQITQSSIGVLSTNNNGATITGDTPSFNGTCTSPTLPANTLASTSVDRAGVWGKLLSGLSNDHSSLGDPVQQHQSRH